MSPRLHANWLWLLRKSWSIRWILASIFFEAANMILPLYVDAVPHLAFSLLSLAAAAGAIWTRLIPQPKDGI